MEHKYKIIGIICVAICMLCVSCSQEDSFVDLGLPSGTHWKAQNEKGFYSYYKALNSFSGEMPTKEQCEELKDLCTWEWQGEGYKVIGLNGNSFFMPVSGFRSDGDIYYAVGRTGGFWSSSSIDSDDNAWAWRVAYDKNGIYIR